MQNLKSVRLFFFFVLALPSEKKISVRTILKIELLDTGPEKYTVRRHVCGLFSLEIIRAGAVKGLRARAYITTSTRATSDCNAFHRPLSLSVLRSTHGVKKSLGFKTSRYRALTDKPLTHSLALAENCPPTPHPPHSLTSRARHACQRQRHKTVTSSNQPLFRASQMSSLPSTLQ